jgi:hypothetical protein
MRKRCKTKLHQASRSHPVVELQQDNGVPVCAGYRQGRCEHDQAIWHDM